MKFCFRVYDAGNDRMLAVCDKSILGTTLEADGLRLDVSREFYFSEECDESGIAGLLKSCTIINAVGERIIGIMLESGVLDESRILRISGVPHAQIISVPE